MSYHKTKSCQGMAQTFFAMSKYASRKDIQEGNTAYYKYFVQLIAANVTNDKLSDADFRRFVRNNVQAFASQNTALGGNTKATIKNSVGDNEFAVQAEPLII